MGGSNPETQILSAYKQSRELFFKHKETEAARQALVTWVENPKSILKACPSEDGQIAVSELIGLILRERREYLQAAQVYQWIKDDYQAGYCFLLAGDLKQTRDHWFRLYQERQNHWCVALYGLVTRQLNVYPTLFQIRNHIETDITNLIAAQQHEMLENLLTYGDFLSQLNIESHKFIGRALMHCRWLERAHGYLLKGQRCLPQDPEIYYHLGQYCFAIRRYDDAQIILNQCLLISPSYYPAKRLMEELSASR